MKEDLDLDLDIAQKRNPRIEAQFGRSDPACGEVSRSGHVPQLWAAKVTRGGSSHTFPAERPAEMTYCWSVGCTLVERFVTIGRQRWRLDANAKAQEMFRSKCTCSPATACSAATALHARLMPCNDRPDSRVGALASTQSALLLPSVIGTIIALAPRQCDDALMPAGRVSNALSGVTISDGLR